MSNTPLSPQDLQDALAEVRALRDTLDPTTRAPLVDQLRAQRVEKEKLRVKHMQLTLTDKEQDFQDRYVLNRDVERTLVAIRNRLLGWCTTVAPRAAALDDPVDVQQYLLTELRRELTDLSRGIDVDDDNVPVPATDEDDAGAA